MIKYADGEHCVCISSHYNESMNTRTLTLLISAFLIAGCTKAVAPTSGTQGSSEAKMAWTTYDGSSFGVKVDYPSDYTVGPLHSEDVIEFDGEEILTQGIFVTDNEPEGQNFRVYRTQDAKILDYLQEDKPFTGTKTAGASTYKYYETYGLGTGYMIEKDGWYYVINSLTGPNAVLENMLLSLEFVK